MKNRFQPALGAVVGLWAALACAGAPRAAEPEATCPVNGWQENLSNFLKPDAAFPIHDTINDKTPNSAPDCVFQQWAAEAFVWAIAPGSGSNVLRFMDLPTPADLLFGVKLKKGPHAIRLQLATRSTVPLGLPGFTEGTGAIVEADGNMLVAPNGYPVYASVHMNPSYFATAQKNLVATNGYKTQPRDAYFDLGAAVFKATWMRLAPGQPAPAGAYVTQAVVPVLTTSPVPGKPGSYSVYPGRQVQTVTVALVGLHVVGYTDNHPEFVWGTFEHELNSPRTPDNSFNPAGVDSYSFTFYKGNTPYTQVNQPNGPKSFNVIAQRFAPANNVVLENQTGGAVFPNPATAVADITNVSAQMQKFLAGQKAPQSDFGHYNLIGTAWLGANTYVGESAQVLATNASNAIGSINLANATAETFEQFPKTTGSVQNCFMCHNPTSLPSGTFPARRIAISHVLEYASPQAVPNLIIVPVTP